MVDAGMMMPLQLKITEPPYVTVVFRPASVQTLTVLPAYPETAELGATKTR